MRPIIFARTADMHYYKGAYEDDIPKNGGSYIAEHQDGGECYNFDEVRMEDNFVGCLGYVQLIGNYHNTDIQLHIENIVGCQAFKDEDHVEDVTVVFCSTAQGSKNMRVVGFYKHATVYRYYQQVEFDTGFVQDYYFKAAKEDCVLLPYQERHCNNQWFVPNSGKNGLDFGYGRSHIWYAGNDFRNEKEIDYVERMLNSIDNYTGPNWIDKMSPMAQAEREEL